MAFGPVKMAFAGIRVDGGARRRRAPGRAEGERHRAEGQGRRERDGHLVARAAVDGGTKVSMQADITLTGAAAQMSRGLLPEVSKRLTQQFADCLERAWPRTRPPAVGRRQRAVAPSDGTAAPSEAAAAPKAAPVAAKPVGGIRLGLAAIWSMIAGFFRRLFGGGSKKSRDLRHRPRGRDGFALRRPRSSSSRSTGGRCSCTRSTPSRDAGVGEIILVTGHDAEAVEAADAAGRLGRAEPRVPRRAGDVARGGAARRRRRQRGRRDPDGGSAGRRRRRRARADRRFHSARGQIVRLRVPRRPRTRAALPRDLRRGRPPPRRRRRAGADGLAPRLGGRGADRPAETARRRYPRRSPRAEVRDRRPLVYAPSDTEGGRAPCSERC